MKPRIDTKSVVLLGMMTALILIFSFTSIGSIPIGTYGLVITLNTIPVAISAVALGPVGGLAAGSIFGLFSFLQCFGIGIPSQMGIITLDISPVLTFIQRFVPRALDGFLVGLLHRALSKKIGGPTSSFVAGFFTAFLNTVFFMGALVLLFGKSDFVQSAIAKAGQSYTFGGVIAYICIAVGLNAVIEMITTTIICGGVGTALYRANILSE